MRESRLRARPEQSLAGVLRWASRGRCTGYLKLPKNGDLQEVAFIGGELYLPEVHPLAGELSRSLDDPRLRALLPRLAEELGGRRVGSFRFSDAPRRDAGVIGPVPTALLLMEAAVRGRTDSELLDQVGGADAGYVAEEPVEGLPAELDRDQERVLERLSRPTRVSALLLDLGGERRRWLEALTRLSALDLVRRVEPEFLEPAALGPPYQPHPAALAIWRDQFHLSADPFSLTPDPAFLYLSQGHAEALAGLKLGLWERRGLIVMVGEVGTGKTTLVYSLLTDLDPQIETAYLSNTLLSFEEILQSALEDFGVPYRSPRRLDLVEALNGFLHRCAEEGKTAALVIDEAQNLSDEAFEGLRLLLNFETYKSKLLQIVLVGQPELDLRLRGARLRQVGDRVAVRCLLGTLSRKESREYVDHRLETVGGSVGIFTRPALGLLVRKSRGNPRRINILCHNAMLFAYGRDLSRVSRALVAQAVKDMEGARPRYE